MVGGDCFPVKSAVRDGQFSFPDAIYVVYETHLLVSEYGNDGSDAEVVLFKRWR